MRTVVTVLAVLAAIRRLFVVVRVRGASMHPAYADGDLLLAVRAPLVRVGRPVVFRTPQSMRHDDDPPYRVKRVVAVGGDLAPDWLPGRRAGEHVPADRIVVRGDAERSEDSRQYGYVDRRDVLAVVLVRLRTVSSSSPCT
jgi:signal peptidase I